MSARLTVVVTSISPPNKALKSIAEGCRRHNYNFIVIGDHASPKDFNLDHCEFVSLEDQMKTGLETVKLCPQNTYSRKNIGYLLAIQGESEIIVDTDDDNFPKDGFWKEKNISHNTRTLFQKGWVNVYKYFVTQGENIWPRGLPLDKISVDGGDYELVSKTESECPIQQGLVDSNPDVDAIFRLAFPLPFTFRDDRRIALGDRTWSPFNSQNTSWWKKAFSLMYLPSYCSFRMTDIWRSFVAQRIAWENNWSVLFHEPTVWQERNEHDLMKDFADEIPGYLQNASICNELDKLNLRRGEEYLCENLFICYNKLADIEAVGKDEIPLVQAWINDIQQYQATRSS